MMGFFGSNKIDHPLADPEEAQRVMKELPAMEAGEALDSAAAWCDSLAATTEFRPDQRLELILRIDEAVLPHTRRLSRDYLISPHQTRAREYHLWQINQTYWTSLANAYADSLRRYVDEEKAAAALKPQLALLCARHLNACAGRIKWQYFRYGPIPGNLWLAAGGTWTEAVRSRVAEQQVRLYAHPPATTPQAEYLRLLVLHSSSPDNLLPVEIEIAERLIAHLLPHFALTDLARPENVYWVDAAKPLPPTRLARIPEITPTLRFFATRSALEALGTLRAEIEAGKSLPPNINFGAQYSPKLVLEVIDHLAIRWAPMPPMRQHERRRIKSRLTVVGRFDAICVQLVTHAQGNNEEVDHAESWVVEDVSQGGIGAQVALSGKDWLRVGSLLAMRPEGGSNWLVGVVRRFSRESEMTGVVGIETLSKSPVGLVADSLGLPTPIVLLDPPRQDVEIRVAMSIAAWEEQKRLRIEFGGKPWRLLPQAVLETGAGHAVGRFRAEADI